MEPEDPRKLVLSNDDLWGAVLGQLCARHLSSAVAACRGHRSLREPLLSEREPPPASRGANFTPALLNTLKAVFGTGLLAMPSGFVSVGMMSGFVITGVLGAWCVYAMVLIAESVKLADANAHQANTFGELVTAALGGTAGAVLGSANLVLHQLLCCAAYLVFLSDNLAQVFVTPADGSCLPG